MDFDVRAYAVRGVLVDSGFADVGPELEGWLTANRVRGAIISHYHEDHAGNVERLAARGIPVRMSDETADKVAHPTPIQWHRRWCWGSQPALRTPVERFDDAALVMIPTPGHSSDHHVIWDPERETVFGADLFVSVKVRVAHPWPREDVRRQITSVRAIAALRPARYFDAHRGRIDDPTAQLTAKADWLEETVALIDAAITAGLPDQEIVQRVMGGEDRRMAWASLGDFSRRNFVAGVRATSPHAG